VAQHSGRALAGWLSPWISESRHTPDLLAGTGCRDTPSWCHDDQPAAIRTRSGQTLWAVPYPQELNEMPMRVARQLDAKDFAQMIIDQFDEMLEQSARQPLVMGIALPPYLVGLPCRLRRLRRALRHIDAAAASGGPIGLGTMGGLIARARRGRPHRRRARPPAARARLRRGGGRCAAPAGPGDGAPPAAAPPRRRRSRCG
jgi:hypothetical protein